MEAVRGWVWIFSGIAHSSFGTFIFRYAPEGRSLILSTEASRGKKCSENFDGVSGSI